jgi:hypothetical protein
MLCLSIMLCVVLLVVLCYVALRCVVLSCGCVVLSCPVVVLCCFVWSGLILSCLVDLSSAVYLSLCFLSGQGITS